VVIISNSIFIRSLFKIWQALHQFISAWKGTNAKENLDWPKEVMQLVLQRQSINREWQLKRNLEKW
jgi:hypothetical protein